MGECIPSYTYKAILCDPKIGVMLPCNIVVQKIDNNNIEVVAIDPYSSMITVKNEEISLIGIEIGLKLKKVWVKNRIWF